MFLGQWQRAISPFSGPVAPSTTRLFQSFYKVSWSAEAGITGHFTRVVAFRYYQLHSWIFHKLTWFTILARFHSDNKTGMQHGRWPLLPWLPNWWILMYVCVSRALYNSVLAYEPKIIWHCPPAEVQLNYSFLLMIPIQMWFNQPVHRN